MTDKEEQYKQLVRQLLALLEGEHAYMSVLANTAAALHDTFGERFFWVGFYMVSERELVLGPFQGPVACMHIARGKGVCGTCWEQEKTIVVPDVEQFRGHIACSSESRSEIVVPIKNRGEVKGVIDIDSRSLNAFDAIDARYLEQIADIVARQLYD
mgnify:FL=1